MVKNKKILIVGLANKYSIASSIAKSLHENGAKLGFSYQNERFEKFISTFAKENGNGFTEICDLSNDVDIKKLIERCVNEWGKIDGIVHSVGLLLPIKYLEVLKILLQGKDLELHMILAPIALLA